MKSSTLILTASALALFSFGASAAPPGGGGRPMGGGALPGQMSTHGNMDHAASNMDRTTHAQPDAATHGRNVSDQLADNTKLSSQIKDLTGTNAQQACAGFKSLGDCVSAAHVSKNLDIPFDTLRSKVTGSGAVSLGKAIHELKPDADAKSATREASRQAKSDLKDSG